MIVHKVHNEVREPRCLALWLKQAAEQAQALLPKVIAEKFKAKECVILGETLSEQGQTQVLDVVVCHVKVDQWFVHGEGLSDSFRSVVGCFIVCDVQGLQGAILSLEVLCNSLASFKADLIRIEVENSQRIVL